MSSFEIVGFRFASMNDSENRPDADGWYFMQRADGDREGEGTQIRGSEIRGALEQLFNDTF
jgi:hypothetical protein